MSRAALVAALAALLLLPGAEAQSALSTSISISYDPVSGVGAVNQVVTFDRPIEGPANVTIYLLGNVTQIVNVTTLEGQPVPYSFDPTTNALSALVANTSGVAATYIISGLASELTPGSYTISLDTSNVQGSLSLSIRLPGLYNISCVGPCSTFLDTAFNTTVVSTTQKGVLVVALVPYTAPAQATATQTPPTSTSTQSPSPTPTTSTSPSTTTQSQTQTTASPAGSTAPSGLPPTALIVAVIVAVVLAAIIVILLKR